MTPPTPTTASQLIAHWFTVRECLHNTPKPENGIEALVKLQLCLNVCLSKLIDDALTQARQAGVRKGLRQALTIMGPLEGDAQYQSLYEALRTEAARPLPRQRRPRTRGRR